MKNTARKRSSTEDARPQLRTVLAEAAARTQLALDLEGVVRRDLRELVIAAGAAALAAVLARELDRTRCNADEGRVVIVSPIATRFNTAAASIKHGLRDLDEVGEGPNVYAWDARAQAYAPAAGFGPA